MLIGLTQNEHFLFPVLFLLPVLVFNHLDSLSTIS
jgi:hypothetical protein